MRKKVGEIEFFRFFFSIVILFNHARYLVTENIFFPGGAFAVEFFFLLSGYLMMHSIEKQKNTPIENLGKETSSFVFKKISSFFPELLISYIIGFAVYLFVHDFKATELPKFIGSSFFELTLVDMTGVGGSALNAALWYLSSMLICMMILYPLIRKNPQIMRHVVLPLLGLFLLGYLYQNFTHLRGPSNWIDFTYKGNIRAMAELCVGAECYFAVQWLKKFHLKAHIKAMLTIVKWFCWVLVIDYMWSVGSKWTLDIYYLVVLVVALILTLSQQCLDTSLFCNKFVYFLGKCSLPLYLCHYNYVKILNAILPNSTSEKKIYIYFFVCTFVTTAFVMLLSHFYRTHKDFIMIKLRKICIK